MVEASLVLARRTTRAVASHRLAVLVALVAAAGAIVLAASAWTAIAHPHPITPLLGVIAVATLLTDATCVDLRVGRPRRVLHVGGADSRARTRVASRRSSSCSPRCASRSRTRRPGGRRSRSCSTPLSYAIGVALAAAMTHLVVDPSWEHPLLSGVGLHPRRGRVLVLERRLGGCRDRVLAGSSVPSGVSEGGPASHRVLRGQHSDCARRAAVGRAKPGVVARDPAVLGVAFVVYRSYLRTIQERAIWRHLETITQEINRLDETEIAEVALAGAVALFEADEAELCICPHRPAATPIVYVRHDGGNRRSRCACRVVVAPTNVMARTPPRERLGRPMCAIPLVAHGAQIGVLRVCASAAGVKLNDRERQVLRTYAHTITTSHRERAAVRRDARASAAQRNRRAARSAHAAFRIGCSSKSACNALLDGRRRRNPASPSCSSTSTTSRM